MQNTAQAKAEPLPELLRLTKCFKYGKMIVICGRGETGRHVGFRFQCESVQVQVLSPVPKRKCPSQD